MENLLDDIFDIYHSTTLEQRYNGAAVLRCKTRAETARAGMEDMLAPEQLAQLKEVELAEWLLAEAQERSALGYGLRYGLLLVVQALGGCQ